MKKWMLTLVCVAVALSMVACTTSNTSNSSALPPHMATIKGVDFDGEVPVTMKVGEFYVFTGESKGWVIDTQNPELVKISQGGTKDTYETNPGFQAIAVGRAVVTLTSPKNDLLTIMVTIEE